MRDQIEDELDYVGMKARVYFDTTNDAFKRSGMTRSEFISAMTKSLPETKAEMFAKDLSRALVDEGENYAKERAAYSAKQVVSYYNKEVKKGLLSTEKGGPLFNASSYEVAAATRNKTSYEALIDPTEPSAPIKATVTGVHDADTLYVTTDSGRQLKVRIQNIDAFELKQKLRDGSLDIGKEGQQYLSSLVNNKQVTLFGYGYDDKGRMIARVMTKDGRDAGTIVAEEGYAILTDISELESYPTKAEDMDAVAPSVYRERNK
jgi:endonuclease YncB( thermonuclease family)